MLAYEVGVCQRWVESAVENVLIQEALVLAVAVGLIQKAAAVTGVCTEEARVCAEGAVRATGKEAEGMPLKYRRWWQCGTRPGRESGHCRHPSQSRCEDIVQAGRGGQGITKELGLHVVHGAARRGGRDVL